MQFVQLHSQSAGLAELFEEIDLLMNSLYPAEANDLVPISEIDSPQTYIIGHYDNGELVACGSFVLKEDIGVYAELKRIYVKPSQRGKGMAKAILEHLIMQTKRKKVREIKLETGDQQTAAIKLYESFGFRHCGAFGQYNAEPSSVFMQLALDDGQQ
ncbi:GNAT family N-acetyltransferase [Pseudoalteromonas obscura]|uniref:GNAT family N-acetyltransferase n=1 Tax=Pseudoalteromonas obscura TaxID=3048491 RepID=A0ABT7EGD2_9GAMM|nr:GNAT family N-acetyltransferase [Pseudoalteromonas sp. P94(2023)]MDK2594095.1 GNAT family N-acetyltransferase [Pseudoalteromonas sp. P94(2023)]